MFDSFLELGQKPGIVRRDIIDWIYGTTLVRDGLQQMTTDAEIIQPLKPLASSMNNTVEVGLNPRKTEQQFAQKNNTNVSMIANMYGIAVVEYFGSTCWTKG